MTSAAVVDDLIARVDQIVAALEQIAPPPQVTPAALDANGNPGHVAAGELIESAWGNATVDRIVNRFTTLAQANAAFPGSPNGTPIAISGVPLIGRGGAWGNYVDHFTIAPLFGTDNRQDKIPFVFAGSTAGTTTSGGAIKLPFPSAVTGGVYSAVAISGDGAAFVGFFIRSSCDATGVTFAPVRHDGTNVISGTLRLDFVVHGWNVPA